MQKRRTSSILLIILSCCLLVSLLLNTFLVIRLLNTYEKLSEQEDVEEADSGEVKEIEVKDIKETETENNKESDEPESELNQECRNVIHIEIRTDYDENDADGNTWDKKYVASKRKYDCTFWVQQKGVQDFIYNNEYSLDKFDELVDILCKEELKLYQPQTNDAGQVVKTVLPYKVIVSCGGGEMQLTVANVDELAEAMKTMAEGH